MDSVISFVRRIIPPTETDFYIPATWVYSGAIIDLDFQNGRYWNAPSFDVVPTDFLSISRASIGYAKTAAGTLTQFAANQLRITDLGLLVEDSRTNLVFSSQTLTSTDWNGSATVAADQTAAPDGTVTADSITASGNGQYWASNVGVGISLGAGTVYTASVYLKAAVGSAWTWIQVSDFSANAVQTWVNLSTGALGSTQLLGDGTIDSRSVETLADGWIRLIMSFHFTAAHSVRIGLAPPTTGDNTSDSTTNDSLYAWGAQLEQASFPSSYIPTTTTSVTRAEDLVTCIGSLESIINNNIGSILVDVIMANNNLSGQVILGSNGNWIFYPTSSGTVVGSYNNAAGHEATLGNSLTFEDGVKIALGWNSTANEMDIVGGGGTPVFWNQNSLGGANAKLGYDTINDIKVEFVGYFRRLTVWNTRLADATLQALTAP